MPGLRPRSSPSSSARPRPELRRTRLHKLLTFRGMFHPRGTGTTRYRAARDAGMQRGPNPRNAPLGRRGIRERRGTARDGGLASPQGFRLRLSRRPFKFPVAPFDNSSRGVSDGSLSRRRTPNVRHTSKEGDDEAQPDPWRVPRPCTRALRACQLGA
jgi:hypothetical protein